jgi:hypothetical protein
MFARIAVANWRGKSEALDRNKLAGSSETPEFYGQRNYGVLYVV